MKHFLLGTVFGAAFGFVFSCMKDNDGNRPGKEFDALKHESNRFATALQNAKQASRELSEQLPAAQRTISDISDDVEKYSRHIQPTVDRMKQKGEEVNQDLNSFTGSDTQDDEKD